MVYLIRNLRDRSFPARAYDLKEDALRWLYFEIGKNWAMYGFVIQKISIGEVDEWVRA